MRHDRPEHDWVFDALGTRWTVTTPEPLAPSVCTAVADELDRIDRAWSRFRDDSMVAEIAAHPGSYPVDPVDQPLVDWYRRLYDLSAGAVSPFVGATLSDAGYDARYSLRPAERIRDTPRWDDVLTGHDGTLEVRRPVVIDVGAAGKGFAVDRVSAIVAATAPQHIVDGGGDMVIAGYDTPRRVALEHPDDTTRAIGVVDVADGAICASAVNRRAWADWHHIIDPRTSSPAREVVATWVLAPTAMEADGLATALFFTPAALLRGHFHHHDDGFHHLTVRRSGRVEHTAIPGLELYL